MEVTEDMLVAAVKKAVELKLIPKWADDELYTKNWEMIKQILKAAINES